MPRSVLLLFGPSGSGKGTYSKLIEKKYGMKHLSVGDILRSEVKTGTPLGLQAKTIMEKGGLVADQLIIDMVRSRVQQPDCSAGYILDGFPRTLGQAGAFQSLVEEYGDHFLAVLHLKVVDEMIVKRLAGRLQCTNCGMSFHVEENPPKDVQKCDRCGEQLFHRDDDKEGAIRRRLEVYHRQTEPLVSYYTGQGMLEEICNVGDIDDVFARICSLIDRRQEGLRRS
ncbi:MAG: adenylate kinase [Deltaproteobacteria bacterium]|nr:adenylate kinase [Deltaproteobacteria bacterium]